MSLTELSLRWCRSRNAVSSVLLGHTSLQQARARVFQPASFIVLIGCIDQLRVASAFTLLWAAGGEY